MDSVARPKVGTKGSRKDAPLHPEKTLDIIRLRKAGVSLKEIGSKYGHTPAGILHFWVRWKTWAEEQGV